MEKSEEILKVEKLTNLFKIIEYKWKIQQTTYTNTLNGVWYKNLIYDIRLERRRKVEGRTIDYTCNGEDESKTNLNVSYKTG